MSRMGWSKQAYGSAVIIFVQNANFIWMGYPFCLCDLSIIINHFFYFFCTKNQEERKEEGEPVQVFEVFEPFLKDVILTEFITL